MALPVYTVFSSVQILTSSVANPSVLTFQANHGLNTGDTVTVVGHSGSTPSINGSRVVTVIDGDQVSIPVNVTVAGTGGYIVAPRGVQAGSLSCRQPSKGVDTCSVRILSRDGTFRMQQWAKFWLKKNGTSIFGGIVSRAHETSWTDEALSNPGTMSTITVQGFKTLAEWATFTGTLAAGTWKSQLTTLMGELASYGLTLDSGQVDGPDMPETEHQEESILSILDKKAESINWNWEIDPDSMELLSFEPGTLTCSNLSTSAGLFIGDVSVDRRRESWYANRVVVKVGTSGWMPPMLGEVYYGDNASRVILLDHSLNFYGPLWIAIYRNGVFESYYILEYPGDLYPGGPGPYSYDPARSAIVQDVSETILDTVDRLEFPYNYGSIYPFDVIVEDTGEQALAGYVKTVTLYQPDDLSLVTARAWAAAELARRLSTLTTVNYRVDDSDARAGRVHDLTIPERDISGTFVVNELITQHVAPKLIRQSVVAVAGEFAVPTYREWYKKTLAGGGSNAVSGQGSPPTYPAPPFRSVQFNDDGVFGGKLGIEIYKDETSLVCGDESSIDTTDANSCQAFGYDCHIGGAW